jgi:diguanylate cyclase (GGDEF)-like protein
MRTAKLATTDGLTGLPDNVSFEDNLARRIKSAYYTGKPISILFVDADFFKYVNEIFGNKPAGDNVLRNLSAILAKNRRGSDLVARVGGDEFAFILVDADEAGADRAADRIEWELEQNKFYVEANVKSQEFLQKAKDDGLYLGKEGNKHVLRLTVSVGRRTLSPEELVNFDPSDMAQIQFISEMVKTDADTDMKKRKKERKESIASR